MALLQVFLPDGWAHSATDAPSLRWRLIDGATIRAGESPLDSLPRGAEVELIVPASRVLLTRVKLPPGSTQRLGEVAIYAVEDKLLGDPETIHAAVGERSPDGAATAALVDRGWLIALRNQFAVSGRRPIRMVSAIATVPSTERAWNLIWHGDHGWLRTFHDQGFIVDSASGNVPISLLLAVQEASAANTGPERIIVHAADGHELPDLAHWTHELKLPVEAGSPWSWQRIEAPLNRGINLLQGSLAPSRSATELLARYRIPAILAAAIAGLYIVVSVADWAWLVWQEHTLQARMKEIFQTAFPDAKTIVDAPLQMQRKLADLKREHGEVQSNDFVPLLANALPAIDATSGTLQAIQYDRGKLQLDLRLKEPQSPEALNQRLEGAGVQARVESVNPAPNGVVARVTFTERRSGT